MNGCTTCGGFGMHHDPVAHDAEPPEAHNDIRDRLVRELRSLDDTASEVIDEMPAYGNALWDAIHRIQRVTGITDEEVFPS